MGVFKTHYFMHVIVVDVARLAGRDRPWIRYSRTHLEPGGENRPSAGILLHASGSRQNHVQQFPDAIHVPDFSTPDTPQTEGHG